MSRALAFAFALAASTSSVAFADKPADKPVHASATVEVLDGTAQIDDVITRMRQQQQQAAKPPDNTAGTAGDKNAGLRGDRPPVPLGPSDTHRALAPEPKNQLPGSRRQQRDEHNFDRAERPRPKHK